MSSTSEPELGLPHHSSKDDEAYFLARELLSPLAPRILLVAIQLDLLNVITKAGPISAMELVSHLPTTNPNAPAMVDRILRFLATYSIVSCSLKTLPDGKTQRLYDTTPVCKYLIQNEYRGPLAELGTNFDHGLRLQNLVLEGENPCNKAQDQAFQSCKLFEEALKDNTEMVMNELLKKYTGFENISSLVYVGGGSGTAMNMIVSKYPNIKGINLDLPGEEQLGGDMLEKIPKADAVLMKGIIHKWGDDDCVKLMKSCYDAIPDDGKVIIMDIVLPQLPDSCVKHKTMFEHDALMMLLTGEGRERRLEDFEKLAKLAGFHSVKVVCPVYEINVIEILKKA